MDVHVIQPRLNVNMKIVMVGDGCVGKTSLWHCYTKGGPYPIFVQSIFDNYNMSIQVDGEEYRIQLFDMAGVEGFEQTRTLGYPDTDAFIVMFSVDVPASYENVKITWVPEVRHHCPNIPIVLVGNKTDLREDHRTFMETKRKPITSEMGQHLANKIHAVKYMECSCMNGTGVVDVFQECARTVKKRREAKTKNMIKEIRKTAKKSKKIRKCKMISTHFNDVIDPPVVHYL